MCEIPNYITHYYDEESDLLKNVCSYPDEIAEAFLSNLKESGKRAWLHPGYLEERRTVETWLYDEFVKKGGKPYLKNPLYFVLGENDDFFQQKGFFSHANPVKLRLLLSLFDRNTISFTYPDSMPSLAIATDTTERAKPYRKPIHGQVFMLKEIAEVVREYGMPGDRWKTEEYWRYDRFIEVQVWDDRPIWELLNSEIK
jgi:hypothetical protein